MNLSPAQYAEILSSLAKNNKVPVKEQRRAPRLEYRGTAEITLCDNAKGAVPARPMTVTVRNIASRGIGFLHTSEMAPGLQFVIKISRQGADPVSILAAVAHSRKIHDELYAVGAAFDCVIHAAGPKPAPSAASPSSTSEDEEIARIRQSILA